MLGRSEPKEGNVMAVYVVARLGGAPDVSVGEYIPDGWGAWLARFPSVEEARAWVASDDRETYSSGDAPMVMNIASSRGRLLHANV